MNALISVTFILFSIVTIITCENLQLNVIGDKMLLKKTLSCTGNCLSINSSAILFDCFEKCQSNKQIEFQIINEIPNNENDSIQLICRDSDSLTIQVNDGVKNENVNGILYVIQFYQNDKFDSMNVMQISDASIIKISNLTKDTEYNVTASIFSENSKYRRVAHNLNVKTLPTDTYTPNKISNSSFSIGIGLKNDSKFPYALIRWQSDDMICSYSFGIFILSAHAIGDSKKQLNRQRLLTEPNTLGSIEISNLDFSAEYRLLIRGVNSKYHEIEGEPFERKFIVPTCYSFYGIDYNKCIPMEPKNITTSNERDGKEFYYNIDINWAKSDYFPDRYNVTILTKSNGINHRIVTGTQNHVRFENVKIIDSVYDVLIRAISKAGHSTAFVQNINLLKIKQKFWQRNYIIILVVVVLPILITIVVLLMILLLKCRSKEHYIYPMKFKDEEFRELTKSDMEIKATEIQMGKTLGEGHFGVVRMGCISKTGQIVAVKMLKDTDTISRNEQFEIYRKFLEEIKLMKEIKHENIIKIVGHCTVDVNHLMLLTEFCVEGNLLNYLRYFRNNGTIHLNPLPDTFQSRKVFDEQRLQQCKKIGFRFVSNANLAKSSLDNFFCNRLYDEMNEMATVSIKDSDHHYSNGAGTSVLFVENPSYGLIKTDGYELSSTDCADEQNEDGTRSLSSLDLLAIARQIATGMVHLSDKQIIHRDLAARNILVCSNKTIKIADFGLSRDIYADNIYVKSTAGRLPIKWLALESMLRREFTVKSDIWSYGILIYEIMTLGCSPYPGISTDSLLDYLKQDKRLQKPDICSAQFYEMMLACWQLEPNNRPSFEMLKQMIIEFESSCGNYKAFTVDVRDDNNEQRNEKFWSINNN